MDMTNILTVLLSLIVSVAAVYLIAGIFVNVVNSIVRFVVARRETRRRMAEPETHGDDGGRPWRVGMPVD